MRYTYQYRERYAADDVASIDHQWDILISAFNSSNRVLSVFTGLRARRKVWYVQPEYGYADAELPTDSEKVAPPPATEAEAVKYFLDNLGTLSGGRIAIDITGFMRHTLLVLLYHMFHSDIDQFWLIYSDPARYRMNEATLFSKGGVKEVRQIPGYFGSRDSGDIASDILVLGTGYDVDMMRAVVEYKRRAQRYDVFGLPSLQPPMYQENMLSVALLDDEYSLARVDRRLFASANDPFATAQMLHDTFSDALNEGKIGSLYLSPTGTKAQAVGFALFHLAECARRPASLLLPLPAKYERETSHGHSRTWVYEVDLRLLRAGAGSAAKGTSVNAQ